MRIGLIAPSYALRLGLRALIDEAAGYNIDSAVMNIVFEAAESNKPDVSEYRIDVLILAGEAVTPAALKRIASNSAGYAAVLVLTNDAQAAQLLPRLEWRAWGVLPADCSATELGAALHALSENLVVGKRELMPWMNSWLPNVVSDGEFKPEHLSERESQVLQLLARGLANKQIASELGISEHTVKFHVSSIYTKLGATSRTEAVRIGVQQGLVIL